MREKPILFSTPMVQALLNTKPFTWPAEPIDPYKPFKSMTRRVIHPQPDKDEPNIVYTTIEGFQTAPPGEEIWAETEKGESVRLKPKYEKGDVLWVRETWSTMPYGQCNDGSVNLEYAYKADGSLGNFPEITIAKNLDKWHPSIHMPREAARLFLEVKSVRVEQLQDISEKDAKAEGVGKLPPWAECGTFLRGFEALWDNLNAKRGYSWESNPWVFCYEFMRVEK